ncbi:hypothetical protein [Bathymodiolus platifrons methanotrophic gill symbiont]|nr:hypothetical protein [Bathymodiolus platifrons methanotrophic gill symbiont]
MNVHGFPVKPSGMTVGVIPAPSSSLGIDIMVVIQEETTGDGFCRKK